MFEEPRTSGREVDTLGQRRTLLAWVLYEDRNGDDRWNPCSPLCSAPATKAHVVPISLWWHVCALAARTKEGCCAGANLFAEAGC